MFRYSKFKKKMQFHYLYQFLLLLAFILYIYFFRHYEKNGLDTRDLKVIIIPLMRRIRLISAGLEPVLGYTEKS